MSNKQYSLREIFKNVSGASFVGIDIESVQKLSGGKKNPHQGRVTKKTTGQQVMVFTNQDQNGYENMVQKRLIEEGKDPTDFAVGPLPWGTRVPNSPIIEHTKDGVLKEYLQVVCLTPGKSEYFLDGEPIAKSDIEGMPNEEEKPVIEEGGQGGLSKKVIIRTFSADSLVNVRIDGNEYNFK